MSESTGRRWMGSIGAVVGVVAVVAAMIGGALFLRGMLTTGSSSCSDMAQLASERDDSSVRRVDVIIGIAGNTVPVVTEASEFVRSALRADRPDAQTVVNVTLVNGDRNLKDDASDGCVGRPVLVAPSESDLESYNNSSADALGDVDDALRQQYNAQVDKVVASVAEAIAQATEPSAGAAAGAFEVWSFVSQAAESHEVYVLGTFSIGGNNCLTLERPAALAASGERTLASERVAQCVAAGQLEVATSSALRLTPVGALASSGSQRQAQAAIIDALCEEAARVDCKQ